MEYNDLEDMPVHPQLFINFPNLHVFYTCEVFMKI